MAGRVLAGGRIRFLGSFTSEVPDLQLPEVAFAGRSNVGKSSAINTLLRCSKAARVSSTPGRTQAINLFEVQKQWICVDLPGYGFARVPASVQEQWKALVEGYLADRRALSLVVLLVDARRKPQESDSELLWGLRSHRVPTLVLATKLDKIKRSQQRRTLDALRKSWGLSPKELMGFSSLGGGMGVGEARERIQEAIQGWEAP